MTLPFVGRTGTAKSPRTVVGQPPLRRSVPRRTHRTKTCPLQADICYIRKALRIGNDLP